MLTPEQLERRFDHLGGSDIARAMTGQYGGEAAVIAEKVVRTSWSGNNRTLLGDWAESFLIDFADSAVGGDFVSHKQVRRAFSGWPILEANCDGVLSTLDGEITAVVEAKLVMHEGRDELDSWGEPGTDLVPQYVIVQTHVEMMCTDCKVAHVVALLVDRDDGPRMWRVERNDALCSAILNYAKGLWDRIQRRELPEPDEVNASQVAAALMKLPRENRIVRVPEGHVLEKVVDWYKGLGEEEKKFETMRDILKARLLTFAGDADTLELADGRPVTIKAIQRAGYTVEPGTCVRIHVGNRPRKRKELTDERYPVEVAD